MSVEKPIPAITPVAHQGEAKSAAMPPAKAINPPPTVAIKQYGHLNADIEQQISDWLQAQIPPKQP